MDACLLVFGGTFLFSYLNISTPPIPYEENRLTVLFLADPKKDTVREGAYTLAKTVVFGLPLDFSLSPVFSLIITPGKQRIFILLKMILV